MPLCLLICEWRINYFYSLPYKESDLKEVEYSIKRPNGLSYKNLTCKINELTDYRDYTLQFDELCGDVYGKSDLFDKTITIRQNINYEFYAFSLTHEIMHLKYFTSNERFVNYNAFKVLYESGNEYLKNVALYFLNLDLQNGFYNDYKFAGYAEDIL